MLEENSVSFDIFGGQATRQIFSSSFFVEMQLRDDKGFIARKIASYAIMKDEEQRRLIVLQEEQFRLAFSNTYGSMQGRRLLFDLADALTVQVFYKSVDKTAQESESSTPFAVHVANYPQPLSPSPRATGIQHGNKQGGAIPDNALPNHSRYNRNKRLMPFLGLIHPPLCQYGNTC